MWVNGQFKMCLYNCAKIKSNRRGSTEPYFRGYKPFCVQNRGKEMQNKSFF